ncbi:MAG: GWxTD domain-containing protein [Ignavibacteriales bacterium]|nr:GWxTD domain-containing protein [Ignavibacteriales bacterium]
MTFSKLAASILVVFTNLISAQTDTTKTKEYLKALESLQKKDTTSATTLFQESIRENGDTPSYYELAKIYWQQKDFLLRNKAYENMKMAVMKDEKNIEYKYFYADVCQYFARFESVNQWKEILAIDSTQIKAWINLAEFSGKEFAEWNKSYRTTDIGLSPLQEYSNEDFAKAINYYDHALRIDSSNYDLCLKISLLYEENDKPQLGIPHLKKLERLNKADKNIYLCLGLLYYKSRQLKESFEEYTKALKLMTNYELEDFTLYSVKFILESTFPELKDKSDWQLRSIINRYWKENDPLIISDYNERLLEHYSRVAYANLHFSLPRLYIDGWRTNRGEIVLRYGEPFSRFRVRPEIKFVGEKMVLDPKKEAWNYGNFTIRFADLWMNGNFQFADDSQLILVDNLRRNNPTTFYPKFEGPIFDLPYQSYQFASKNRAQTDIFLSYEINFSDSSTTKGKFVDGYNIGLFMLDNNFNKKFENKKTVSSIEQTSNIAVNTLEMTLQPLSGNLAFEMERKKDKGVMAYHGKYNIRSFSGDELKISDVVLASTVETEQNINGAFKRNNISILPNPTKSFRKNDQFFLYYEIYNLTKNTNNITDFEQKITMQKKEEGGIISSLLSVVGLDKEGKRISLTSKYQTQERDPQMYLQLDMSKYEPGEYVITVTIKDIITGKEVSNQTEINWQ